MDKEELVKLNDTIQYMIKNYDRSNDSFIKIREVQMKLENGLKDYRFRKLEERIEKLEKLIEKK